MYNKKTVSVVISTYREKNSIRKFIVVNNNAEEGTDQEIAMTEAILVYKINKVMDSVIGKD